MRNKLLDLIRLIAAFMVILIHAPLPGVAGQAVESVSRVAVPLFFMVSGYYAWGKSKEALMNSAKKTAALLLWSTAVYFVWGALWSLYQGTAVTYFTSILSVRTLVETVVFNNGSLLGHLWFLLALLYCYLLYTWFLHKVPLSAKMCISAVLYVGLFLVREVLKMNGAADPVYYLRNSLFVGIPFFLLGNVIHQQKEWVVRYSTAFLVTLIGVGTLAAVAERFCIGCCDMYVGTGVAAVALFILSQKAELPTTNLFADIGAQYAGDIYIFHSLIIGVLNAVASLVGILQVSAFAWIRPVLVLVISIGVAYCKQVLERKMISKRNTTGRL